MNVVLNKKTRRGANESDLFPLTGAERDDFQDDQNLNAEAINANRDWDGEEHLGSARHTIG